MLSFTVVAAKFPSSVLAFYDFSNAVYTGALQRITGVRCPEHGVFSQYAAQFRKGRGCPACGAAERARKKRTSVDDYVAKVSELHGGQYTYDRIGFRTMNGQITVTCPVHGDFEMCANHHYYRRQGCGRCEEEAKKSRILAYRHLSAESKIANTAVSFFDRCRAVHDNRYDYPEQPYRGPKHKLQIVCPTHGEFRQAAWAHLSGKGCFKCGAADPKWERALVEFLSEFGLAPQRSAPVLDGKHVDIFIPERNFGVELHGLHWHTERRRGADYHRQKWQLAAEKGIRLIQVFEDEWVNKQDVVKARIAAMLGFGPKFDARKCEVRLCDTDGVAFLNAHHIQGSGRASVYYGLYQNDELLAVASFAKARSGAMVTGATSDWEVIRYASIGRVRGGFGRLFKRFLADVGPSRVISYCDLRYGDGKLYAATGFTLEAITPPDYWWVPNGKTLRVPRYETQKHKLPTHPVLKGFYAPGMTEKQVCEAAGWGKIFGVGHQRWVWTVDTLPPS